MKKNLFLGLILILSASCNDMLEETAPEGPLHAYADREGIKFMAYPLEVNKLELTFHNDTLAFSRIILMDESDTLAAVDLHPLHSSSFYSGALNFNFDPDRSYSIVVESAAQNDTVYRYQLPPYQHNYVSEFEFKSLHEFKQRTDFDFSPTGNKLFIGDYNSSVQGGSVEASYPLYVVDLNSRAVTLLDLELPSSRFRAISDNELLTRSYSLDGQYIGNDSVALVKTNIATNETEVLGFGSSSYGRTSRIVDGHVMYNAAWPNIYDHYLLNVHTGNITTLGNLGSFVRPHQYEGIVVGAGHVFNVGTQTFEEVHSLVQQGKNLLYEDDNGYRFFIQYHDEDALNTLSMGQSFYVERDSEILYEQPHEAGRFYSTRQKFNVENGKFVVYKNHYPSEAYRINGYYEIDLNSGTERLIKSENVSIAIVEFDLGEKGILAVRANRIGYLE